MRGSIPTIAEAKDTQDLLGKVNDRIRRINAILSAPETPSTTTTITNLVAAGLTLTRVTTDPYTIVATDDILLFELGSGVAYLPQISGLKTRKILYCFNESGGNVVVAGYSGDTVGGNSGVTLNDGSSFPLVYE